MSRYKQYSQLVTDLKAELGRSTDAALRNSDLAELKQAISTAYETLYDEYDWPHLRIVFPKIRLQAGERFYDCPTDMDFDRMETVAVWQNGLPVPIDRGIGFPEYAIYDSEGGTRSDPALRWDIRYEGAGAARGSIEFSAQPDAASTITINGQVFTFVAGTPSDNEIQIGDDLDETLANAVDVLNASTNINVDDATYSVADDTIEVVHDTLGTAGNAFTLAAAGASNGTVSGATLTYGTLETRDVLEFWPVPASNGYFVQFIGIKKFDALVADADVCLIDDKLVIQTAAIGIDKNDTPKARARIANVTGRLTRLKGRGQAGATSFKIGGRIAPSRHAVTVSVSGR